MPLVNKSRSNSGKTVHRTRNYIMQETTEDDEVTLTLTSTSNKFDKLVSTDMINNSLDIHILKQDLATYEECNNLGQALTELSEFLDVIEENY